MKNTAIYKLQILAKNGSKVYVIFDSRETQKAYIKAEGKFCKQAYIDYSSAFTKVARELKKEALETQRRLFAETQQYAPSKKNPAWWIFKPEQDKITA
ncbi:MAG: hypothetical protein DRN17_06275 [Thermoplasmata archaeon]|nr:MAG: hypothetical protein DRN17_06275 [Thermoplasmata archaeon]